MTQLSAVTLASAEPIAAPVPVASGPLVVEIKRDLDLAAADARAFDALLAGRPNVGVFASRPWLTGLFHDPPPGVEPGLLLLRDAATLRGVVPIAIHRRRTHVRVGLLGGGLVSDRIDLVACRGFETACADAFMAWVGEAFGPRGYEIAFRDVPAESPLWGAVHRANAERTPPLTLQPREIHALPYLDLAEARGEGPKSLGKHQRWLERRGRLRIEVLHDPEEALAAFDTLAKFLHLRWRGDAEGSALSRPYAARFHRHVIPLLLGEQRLRMIRMSIDMRTVAVFYGLALGRWWGYYQAGYDREWAGRIHLGQLNLAGAIEAASREGAAEFDFLKGVERVKYLWPVRERSALDADAYSADWAAQFSRAAAAARESAAGLAKSARALWSMVGQR
jgi:CelD/BcsL family acetyltransferase involved in cellulose biosynthesis